MDWGILLKSTLLLLALQLCTRSSLRAAAARSASNPINCFSHATESCIITLLDEELLPLQHSLENITSSLYNSTFVEGVMVYSRGPERVDAIVPQLSNTSLTLMQLYVTGNTNLQKVNSLSSHLTYAEKVNGEWSVDLLDWRTALLLRHIELNATKADTLFLNSLGLLVSVKNSTFLLHQRKIELNTAIHQLQDVISSFTNSINTTQCHSSKVDRVFSESYHTLFNVSYHHALEESLLETARNVLSEMVELRDKIKSLGIEKINRSMIRGQADLTLAEEIEQDILKELTGLVEVESGVELLLEHVVAGTGNTGSKNNVTSRHLQNIVQLLNQTSQILIDYEEYSDRLKTLSFGADGVILHAINLGQQVERITRRGQRFLDTEFVDESDRVSIINTTVYQTLNLFKNGSLAGLPTVPGPALDIQALNSGRLLAEAALNVTPPSLSQTRSQLWRGLLDYDSTSASYFMKSNRIYDTSLSMMARKISQITQRITATKTNSESMNSTIKGVSSLITRIDVGATSLLISNTSSSAAHTLSSIAGNSSEVIQNQQRLQSNVQAMSLRIENMTETELMLNDSLNHIISLVSTTLYLIDQTNYPVEFKENSTVLRVGLEDLMSRLLSAEFRSLTIQFSPNTSHNSVLLHIVSYGIRQALTELLVEIVEGYVRVTFRRVTRRGVMYPMSINVSDSIIVPGITYSLFVSRTGVNIHVELRETSPDGRVYPVDRVSSSIIRNAFTSSGFLSTASLYVSGGSSQLQSNGGRFSGCIAGLEINSYHFNLWNLSLSRGITDLSPCSGNLSNGEEGRGPNLELGGWEYAQQWVNGSFLPVLLEFRTLLPNGILLYTHSTNSSQEELNSCLVYLDQGKIEVRVRSGTRQRILTSSHTYNNGASAIARIELDNSSSRLVLRTRREVVRKRLVNIPTESLSTYSELLVGGVGERVREAEGVDKSNFTGCVGVYSSSSIPKVPRCFGTKTVKCSYCSSNEVALKADFYGASYVVFPAIIARQHFDISLKFQTRFENGLLLFTGNVAEAMWLAVVLDRGRLLLFVQTSPNTPFSLSYGSRLADNHLHTVTIIRSGSILSIKVDDSTSDDTLDVFASLLPSGAFSSPLFIGGVPSSYTHLLHTGLIRNGFKGHLQDISINGRALDFSENLEAADATFVREDGREEGSSGQNDCEFRFSGLSSYAEYDIGRFQEEFSLGFQFFTDSENGLLFYIFSRRRTDKMAVQLNDSSLQLYIQDTRGEEHIVSVQQSVSLREWHDVRLTQRGNNLTISLDDHVDQEKVVILQNPLRTTSPLYIGGLPSDRRIPTTSNTVRNHFTGCMRSHQLSLSSIRHQVQKSSCEKS